MLTGRSVHRVLNDQGSSVNFMLWDIFVGLQISREVRWILVGFSGEHVEVRGYMNLRTTFIDGTLARTVVDEYMVVNTPSSYNLILGRP